MTKTEQRRTELLNQTRKIYSERNTPPAIHPRYTGAYNSIYKSSASNGKSKTTFGIRIFIALLLFGLFFTVHMKEKKVAEKVVGEIQREVLGFVDLESLY